MNDSAPRDDSRLQRSKFDVSFEFFPPANEAANASLWDAVQRLQSLRPHFVSVTYGAGGSTREWTFKTVKRIQRQMNINTAAHLTCVGSSKADVMDIVHQYRLANVRHIVALRGDPQGEDKVFKAHPQGFKHSVELIAAIKAADSRMQVSAAAYPEVHPEAQSPTADLNFLKAKAEAGADRAITQFFFDVDVFLRFRDRAVKAGIDIPIVPGILPVTNYARVVRFASMCGTSLPKWLQHAFDGLDEDSDTRRLVAASVASEQCRRLLDEGVSAFHFYTLNRAELTFAICRYLGIQPQSDETLLAS